MKFTGPIDISSGTKGSTITEGSKINLLKSLTPTIKKQLDTLVSNICISLIDISNSGGIPFYELTKALQEHILFHSGIEIAINHFSYLVDKSLTFSRKDLHSGDGIIKIKQKQEILESVSKQLEDLSVSVNKELLDISQVTGMPVSEIGNLFFNNLNSFVITKNNTELFDNSFIGKIASKIKRALTFNPIIISNGTKGNSCSVNKPGPM